MIDYTTYNRRELQQLAKQYNIKANQSNQKIIQKFNELNTHVINNDSSTSVNDKVNNDNNTNNNDNLDNNIITDNTVFDNNDNKQYNNNKINDNKHKRKSIRSILLPVWANKLIDTVIFSSNNNQNNINNNTNNDINNIDDNAQLQQQYDIEQTVNNDVQHDDNISIVTDNMNNNNNNNLDNDLVTISNMLLPNWARQIIANNNNDNNNDNDNNDTVTQYTADQLHIRRMNSRSKRRRTWGQNDILQNVIIDNNHAAEYVQNNNHNILSEYTTINDNEDINKDNTVETETDKVTTASVGSIIAATEHVNIDRSSTSSSLSRRRTWGHIDINALQLDYNTTTIYNNDTIQNNNQQNKHTDILCKTDTFCISPLSLSSQSDNNQSVNRISTNKHTLIRQPLELRQQKQAHTARLSMSSTHSVGSVRTIHNNKYNTITQHNGIQKDTLNKTVSTLHKSKLSNNVIHNKNNNNNNRPHTTTSLTHTNTKSKSLLSVTQVNKTTKSVLHSHKTINNNNINVNTVKKQKVVGTQLHNHVKLRK